MNSYFDTPPAVAPIDILSGIGVLARSDLCNMIAMLEVVDGLFLAQGAAIDIKYKIGRGEAKQSSKVLSAASDLETSRATDACLRFRLWQRLSEALAIQTMLPLSARSAAKAAAALAVRSSERLSPSIRQRRDQKQMSAKSDKMMDLVGRKAADLWDAGKKIVLPPEALSFPDIVKEEILNFFSDQSLVDRAAAQADPDIATALKKGHEAAVLAIAAGGSWATFAVLIANAGFAPYILAAQVSAFIPMVGGPALVSLLATLVNPLTVMVGVGALGWLGIGRGSRIVRSQVAARMCVLLAMSGSQAKNEGLGAFLGDMRHMDREPASELTWLRSDQRTALRSRLAVLNGRMQRSLPVPANAPPAPWKMQAAGTNLIDALATASLTAGDMVWHATAINRDVMRAADFSRLEDLGDPIAFAMRAQDFALEGANWSLRGYTAERLVLDRLIADGHDVRIPENSNTPGLDLIVDGYPVQVKCGKELSNLSEHFAKYPDIPVIANTSLAQQASESDADWAHLVTTIPGFEIRIIEERVAEALGHAAALADPNILQFALYIGVLRGGFEVAQGRVPLSDLPAWLLLDGASRGALGAAGGKAGAWLGLVAIGPAGALILGPAIGCAALLGNGVVKNEIQKRLMSSWTDSITGSAAALQAALRAASERRISRLAQRVESLTEITRSTDFERWLVARAVDDHIAALEERISLDGVNPTSEAGCLELLFLAPELAPADAAVLKAVWDLQTELGKKPGLQEALIGEKGKQAISQLRKQMPKAWFREGSKKPANDA